MKKRSIAFSAGRFMGTFAGTKSFLQIDKRPIGIICLARYRILSGGSHLIYSLKPFVLRYIRALSHPASNGDIKASAGMRHSSCICTRNVSGMTAIFVNWMPLKARPCSYDSIEPGFTSDHSSKGAEAEDPLIFSRASNMPESLIKSFTRKLSGSDNPLTLEDQKTGPIAADDEMEISSRGPYLGQRPMRSSIDLLGEDLMQTPEPSFMEPRNADRTDAYGVQAISLPWRNSLPPFFGVPHSAAKKSEAAQERIKSTKSNIGQEASLGEEIISRLNTVNASLDRFICRRSFLSGEVKMEIGDVAGMLSTARIFGGVHRDLKFIGAGRDAVERADNSERSGFPALVHSKPDDMNQPDNSSRNSLPPFLGVPHSAAKKSEAAQEHIKSSKSNIGQEASLGEEIIGRLNIVNASLDRFISRRSLLSGDVKMEIGDVAGMLSTARIFGGVHRDLRFNRAGRDAVERADNSERSGFPALVHSKPDDMNQPDNSSRYESADGPDSPSMAAAIRQPHKAKIRAGQASFVYRDDLQNPREAPNEIDLSSLAERVYTIIERKTKIEMERRGLYSRS